MEIICDKSKCSGCRSCEYSCPVNAISMKENERGFLYPQIDQNKCIDCGICKNKCQVNVETILSEPLKIYACKNKISEIRERSSSGGVFYELSNSILKEKGSIYGAGFDENNKVIHVRAEDKEELENIKRSKYVQSDLINIIEDIKNDVNDGKNILFSGTPCQIRSIKDNVDNKYEKISFVEVVCHGVPSPKIFEDYKKYLEKKYNSKIKEINFRYKNDVSTQNLKVLFENGKEYIGNELDGDIYYRLFLRNLILRESCYDCVYKNFKRNLADISLADFWGIQKGKAKDFGDEKGISLVLINTQKGFEMFNEIKDNLEFVEITKDMCEPYNCFKNFEIPENVTEVFKSYIENGFESIIKYVKD